MMNRVHPRASSADHAQGDDDRGDEACGGLDKHPDFPENLFALRAPGVGDAHSHTVVLYGCWEPGLERRSSAVSGKEV